MNLRIDYIDNLINIGNEFVTVLEVENKKYFYRMVKDLRDIEKNGFAENVTIFDDKEKEVSANGKIKVYVDYFDLGLESKKVINELNKYVFNNIEQEDSQLIKKHYKKIVDLCKKIMNHIDVPLKIEDDSSVDSLIKLLKIGVEMRDDLLNNLLLLMDLENMLQLGDILVFINLKQYLNVSELKELYKYSKYKQVNILLIDSQCYGTTQEYEKKIIIDENLEEFVL